MGGDGGVIASNRRYMRGAGTADHTGDNPSQTATVDPAIEKEERLRTLRTCAVSNKALNFEKDPIVVCPYGRLYIKEQAVQELLKRKQNEDSNLPKHIHRLKDLKDARFQVQNDVPVCPVTGTEINGNLPTFLLVPGNPDQPNVLTEKAMKTLDRAALEEEYGPIEQKIRLAPPKDVLQEIMKAQSGSSKKRKKHSKDKKEQKKAKSNAENK